MPPRTVSLGPVEGLRRQGQAQGGERAAIDARKFRVLSINTSAISYDFEQAKKPGDRLGDARQSPIRFSATCCPSSPLTLTHDLWDGTSGSSGKFDPFLSSVSASFALSGNTFRAIGSIFGLGGSPSSQASRRPK